MDKVDQFESLFKSATKQPFQREDVSVTSVAVVADGDASTVTAYAARLRGFLKVLGANVRWTEMPSDSFASIDELLTHLEEDHPDLVCTHRHVGSPNRRWASTLGETLDVLTQATSYPVLVAPHPAADHADAMEERGTETVMVMTDHLTGDGRLINTALRYTSPEGTLALCHVEDDAVFARYEDAISKIPELDTTATTEALKARLLKDPGDYIATCDAALKEAGVPVTVAAEVTFGHRLETWRELVHKHNADLLVMNTKDEDQHAMHGLAYPIAVEMRDVPLLML